MTESLEKIGEPAPGAPLRIGARPSPLSTAQATHVAELLSARGVECRNVWVTTEGDTDRRHLTEIGGTGVFAQALRNQLAAGEIDLAVHSAKDLPTVPAPGLQVVAHPVREDSADVLVGRRLAELTDGLRIGTGSPRRATQLRAWAAQHGIGLEIVAVRGNVGSRLDLVRSGKVDAVVLAAAGLRRLDLLTDRSASEIAGLPIETLPDEVMLPAPAQGALALEVASSNSRVLNLVKDLDDPMTTACVTAERSLLATLEAGCLAPVGAVARVSGGCGSDADLTMAAVIGKTIGSDLDPGGSATELIRVSGHGPAARAASLGAQLAGVLLDRLGVTTLRTTDGTPN